MSHHKDTEYLNISTRIHAMENRLLTRERMERMIEAKEPGEAAKILAECGYGEWETFTQAALERLLAGARRQLFQEMAEAVPHRAVVELFQVKYDYHNAKTLLKAGAADARAEGLLLAGGRYDPSVLADCLRREDLRDFPPLFRGALVQGGELLSQTGDPQRLDFLLDRACFEEMVALAAESGNDFLQGYVRLMVDAINLRGVVRAARLEKGADFLRLALLPGGSVDADTLCALRGEEAAALFRGGRLDEAAALATRLARPEGGALTQLERLCDDAVTEYLSGARRVPFGPESVVSYLHAREQELVSIRTILTGRMAGLDADTIRSRLRAAAG